MNALNEQAVEEIGNCFQQIASDPAIKAAIFTAEGPFFSFGFDIPEFISYSKAAFTKFLDRFTGLYTDLFTFPKPVVAALNGHTIAAGCMLALACDYRIMVSGKAKISLNEITFGSSVFAGSVAMLESLIGARNARGFLYDGTMCTAESALEMGLIDQVSTSENLVATAQAVARRLAGRDGAAFGSIKKLLRAPVAEQMRANEKKSIEEFADIWYSESTWRNLQAIKIHS